MLQNIMSHLPESIEILSNIDEDVEERQRLLDLRLNAVDSDDDLYNNLIRVRKDGGRLLLTGYVV